MTPSGTSEIFLFKSFPPMYVIWARSMPHVLIINCLLFSSFSDLRHNSITVRDFMAGFVTGFCGRTSWQDFMSGFHCRICKPGWDFTGDFVLGISTEKVPSSGLILVHYKLLKQCSESTNLLINTFALHYAVTFLNNNLH